MPSPSAHRASEKPANVLEQAYRHYAADLYRYIFSKVGQAAVAEDLTSTVFFKALRWVEPGRTLHSIRGWLYATARTTVVDYWHTQRRIEILPLEVAEELEAQNAAWQEMSPQISQRVQQLLALLPLREREILNLRYFQGYSTAEIGQALGLKAGNVRVLQLRALRLASQVEDKERNREISMPKAPKDVSTSLEYTEQAKHAFELAREEAMTMRHGFVGTEHLLLGLIREGSVAPLLEHLGVDLVRVRGGIAFLRGGKPLPGRDPSNPPGMTRHVQKVLEKAEQEARLMGEQGVYPRHILLGLMLHPESVAGDLLLAMDVDLETVRNALAHPDQPAVLMLTCSFCRHKHAQIFSSPMGTALPAIFSERVLICSTCVERFHELFVQQKAGTPPSNFRWQIQGKLAGVSFPQSEAALAFLKEQGIRALVSLSEMALAPELLTSLDLQAKHVPIADFSAPTISQVEQALEGIKHFLENNRPVAIHCGAGLGRTGTILACYLVWQGIAGQDAIAQVRAQQPGSIETEEQEALIYQYERLLREAL